MAKVTVHIRNVSWRDGRPRFEPGPGLRRLGYKGEDLRHPDGRWFSLEEAGAWAEAKAAEISTVRDKRAAGGRARAPAQRRAVYTLDDLFHDWEHSPKWTGGADVGKRKVKVLAEASQASYRKNIKRLQAFDADLCQRAVAALTRPIMRGLFERLWEELGQTSAVRIIATVSAAVSWAMLRGKVNLQVNPCEKLKLEQPAPRLRVGTPAEIRALVAAADAEDLPSIGDAILLGLWTGQRQADRIALVDAGLQDGRRVFRQAKTGAVVMIPEAPELRARLEAARQRVRAMRHPVKATTVIVSEGTGRAYLPDDYRHKFIKVRDAAAEQLPSLADFRDQDLRDTAVTWLGRAGCTVPEIAAITGHSPVSITSILKHYLALHPELADRAIAKVVAWYDGQEQGEGA